MIKLTREEANHLNELYDTANKSGGELDWDKVSKYYQDLGNKYRFDPKEVTISKWGKVSPLLKCFKCGNVATTSEGTIYVRDNSSGKWESMPICWTCYARHYPEKAFAEVNEI